MNIRKLKAKMAERGETTTHLATVLGITVGAANRKVNGHTEFKLSDILAVKDWLNLTYDELIEIFFRD